MYSTGLTDESVSTVGLWQLLTPPVGINRHCIMISCKTETLGREYQLDGGGVVKITLLVSSPPLLYIYAGG